MTIRDELQRWARAKSWRVERAESGPHALSRAREFAPMTREKAQKRLMGRDGISRRTAMGVAAGRVMTNPAGQVVRVLPVPMWACDPVPSRNDAGPGFDAGPWIDEDTGRRSVSWVDPVPDDLLWVGRAVAQLERANLMRARVLWEEFFGTGSQRERAAALEKRYGGRLTLDMYRKELRRAFDFMEDRQALDNAA